MARLIGAPPALATITLVQVGPEGSAGGSSITATLSSASTAGNLLVATVQDANSNCVGDTFSAPSGWVRAAHVCRGGNGPLEVWYDQNAAAGITSVTFNTGSSGSNSRMQISEWSGVALSNALDQTGTASNASSVTALLVSTSGNLATSGELAVTGFLTATGLSSFTPGGGWSTVRNDPGNGLNSDYRINPSSGAILSETVTSNPQTSYAAAIATFLPACAGGSLTVATAPTLTFPTVTLNAYNATSTATVNLTLDDETGSGSGWNLNATSTTFSASGGKTLPTTATTITAASAVTSAGNCNLPTNAVSYPVTLPAGATPPTAVKLFDATANTGQGPSSVTLTAKVALPANARAGSYSSTWTFTVSTGP